MAQLLRFGNPTPTHRYANALRCIGQSIQSMELKAVEIRLQGDRYIVQLWNKGTSLSMDLEQQYTVEELRQLDAAGRHQARNSASSVNLLGLSHVLRLAGNYVDRARGRH